MPADDGGGPARLLSLSPSSPSQVEASGERALFLLGPRRVAQGGDPGVVDLEDLEPDAAEVDDRARVRDAAELLDEVQARAEANLAKVVSRLR